MAMLIAKFNGLTDTSGMAAEAAWEDIAKSLAKSNEKESKAGKLWAPIEIVGSRKDENVKSLGALVLDFDDGHDWADFLSAWSQYEFVVHTTHSHTADKPKWRAIFPLESPVTASDWPSLYRRWSIALGKGCSDPSCSNLSRIYFQPSHKPGVTPFYYRNEGRFLSALDGADLSVAPATGTRPGDDFNSRARWNEILEPHGWRFVRGNYWVRPGKNARDGISAIADDVFYCWSSNAGIPANKAMSPFTLYAHLNHRGDFSAAAKDLKSQGYGGSGAVASGIVSQISEVDTEYDASPYSEAGNAARFAQWAAPRARYAWRLGKWLEWDGRRWKPDDKGGGCGFRLVAEWAKVLRAEAAGMTDADARKKAWQFACSLDARKNISTCLDMSSRHECIAVLPDELDQERHLICIENGVLDLDTGKLTEHDPDLMMTKLAPVRFDSFSQCPKWMEFLETFLPDEELRDYVQKAAGYSLTGYTGERKFFFLYGALGGNGKSTLVNVLARVLGDYCVSASPETFMLQDRGQSATNDIARLAGARLVRAAEQEDGKKLAESLIKRITGNDPLTARFLHQEFFDFEPRFKLWMMGNHKPTIKGTDDAIWDRIGLVPFDYSLPPEQRDPNFGKTFDLELSGIFKWMFDGYNKYKSEGLKSPKAIREAVQEYRTDSDVLGAFLECCTVKDDFDSCKSSVLYEVYSRWSKQNGHMALSQTAFSKRLKERGFEVRKGMGANEFQGIRVDDSMLQPETPRRHWNDC